jgi:hypothetical protein
MDSMISFHWAVELIVKFLIVKQRNQYHISKIMFTLQMFVWNIVHHRWVPTACRPSDLAVFRWPAPLQRLAVFRWASRRAPARRFQGRPAGWLHSDGRRATFRLQAVKRDETRALVCPIYNAVRLRGPHQGHFWSAAQLSLVGGVVIKVQHTLSIKIYLLFVTLNAQNFKK